MRDWTARPWNCPGCDVTREELDAHRDEWLAWAAQADEEEAAEFSARVAEIRAFTDRLNYLFGAAPFGTAKAVSAAIKKNHPTHNHNRFREGLKRVEENIAAREVEAKKKRDADDAEAARAALHARAVVWLIARGEKPGETFDPVHAVSVANDRAFTDEVNRIIAEGGLVSFSGDDNCEACGGWNGRDRRCECGNRRVTWEAGYGHSFENPCVYAVAF